MSSDGPCVPKNLTAVELPSLWDWEGWYTIICLVCMFITLWKDWVRTEFAMVGCLTMIWAAQIINTNEALVGMSNSGVLTVAILYIVAEGLSATGGVDYFMGKLMGKPTTLGLALIRMMVPVAAVSAFLNNTPLVALMIPIIQKWSRKVGLPPSQLMIPLSYATILGGTITMIGTSTNLVVAGRAKTFYCRNLGIFDLSVVGIPVAALGIAYILLFAPYFLPDAKEYERRRRLARLNPAQRKELEKRSKKTSLLRKIFNFILCRNSHQNIDADRDTLIEIESVVGDEDGKKDQDEDDDKFGSGWSKKETADFILHAVIPADSEVVGRTVASAGLRGEDGLYLISVQRGNTLYSAVGRGFELLEGDLLSFTGLAENFVIFCSRKKLQPLAVDTEGMIEVDPISSHTIQAVIRDNSDLVGRTPKEADFRKRYNAAILSIFRAGQRLRDPKLGQVKLKVGDVLVCLTNDSFDWNDIATSRDLKPRHNPEQAQLIQHQDSSRGELDGSAGVEREFFITMKVGESSKLGQSIGNIIGKSVEFAGLRAIPGVFLFMVQRGSQTFRVIGPDFVLAAGDILWFSGEREGVNSLRRIPGLVDVDTKQLEKLQVAAHQRRIVEVVVSLTSELLYKTVRETRFRSRFSAAIVAIHREGAPILSTIGDVVLQPGDVLLLDAGPNFLLQFRDDPNFLLVSELDASSPPRFDKFYIALVSSILMVGLTAIFEDKGINLALLALITSGIMLSIGCLTGDRAMASINWGVIITVASAFGISTALEKTYVAPIFGNAFVDLAKITNTGEIGVLTTVMAATALLSSVVANNAASLLMFPIGAQAAATLGVEPTRMLYALMLGASDYATPFGYQTNLMVYGPGGYVFADYAKFGGPFMLYLLIIEVLVLASLDYWYIMWIASFAALLFVVLFDVTVRGKMPLRQVIGSVFCCFGRSRNEIKQRPSTPDIDGVLAQS